MHQKLAEGESGILSCSALKKKYRDRLRIDPEKVHFIYLKGNYELIRERMEKRRDHYMPADLLRSQFETLEEPGDVFTIEIDQKPSKILSQAMFYITNKI
jgi:carbohydrate kinase (thermoresistant glucokinase family)